MNNDNLMPELQDLINRIKAFNSVHKEGVFIYNFMGFKESEEVCEDCGEHCALEPDDDKSICGAYGDIEDIRYLANMIRDIAEDEKDEDRFVNI